MADLDILRGSRKIGSTPPIPRLDPEDVVRQAARRHDVDENLALSVTKAESSFDPSAISPKGAIGLMQLMPRTARELGVNPYNIVENAEGGVRYLKKMLDRNQGDPVKAVASYNAGPKTIDKGIYPPETVEYLKRVFPEGAPAPISDVPNILRGSRKIGEAPPRTRADIQEPEDTLDEDRDPGWLSTVAGIGTTSLLKSVGGVDLSKEWQKEVLPRAQQALAGEGKPSWAGQLAIELTKVGPEAVEFFTSPLGLVLTAAHIVPQTRPFAALADVGLGAMGIAASIPSGIQAAKTREPKDVARAIIDLSTAIPFIKAGKVAIGSMGKSYETGPIQAVETLRKLKESAPGDWKAVISDLETAKTKLQSFEQMLYRTPALRSVASILNIPKPTLLSAADELVQRRAGFLGWQDWRADKFAWEIKHSVPAEDRTIQKLGYVIQGSATPDEVGLSKAGRAAIPKLQKFAQEEIDLLRKAYGENIPLQDAERYLSQIWDFRKDVDKSYVAQTLMRDPFLKRRKVMSYKEGIEQKGLTPKFDDVIDVITTRHRTASRAIANQEFANKLKDAGLLLSQSEATHLGLGYWPSAMEAPALYRAAYGGKTPTQDPIFRYVAPKIHPEIEMAVNAIFANPLRSQTVAIADQVRSFSKMNRVGWSLFHNTALSEQSHGIYATRSLKEAAKATYIVNPETYKGLRAGVWEVMGKQPKDMPPMLAMNPDIIGPALEAGLVYRSPEYERGIINWMRHFGERSGPMGKALGAPMRWAGNGEYIWNKSMWDYYAQGQMVNAYHRLYASELNRLGSTASPEQLFSTRRTIARHINNVFGMENLESLLMTPNTRKAMNFLLFAPMWTISNVRTPLAGLFEGQLHWNLTKRWVAGAAGSWFLTTQLTNYALSSWYNTEDKHGVKGGHWTWDNPGAPMEIAGRMLPGVTENAINISAGYNPDGTQRFIRFGKGFREPFLWMLEPIKTLGGKLSIPFQWAVTMASGSQPGGFQVVDRAAPSSTQMAQRLTYTAEQFIPFTGSEALRAAERGAMPQAFPEPTTSGQYYGMPTRKGITMSGAVSAINTALDQNRSDLIDDILVAAKANNINPANVIASWASQRRKQLRMERGPLFEFTESGEPRVAIPMPRQEE